MVLGHSQGAKKNKYPLVGLDGARTLRRCFADAESHERAYSVSGVSNWERSTKQTYLT